MSDEEAALWMQELVTRLAEERGSAGGACSLEAIKNPVRRAILITLDERALPISEISERLGVSGATLRYHLNFLASSYFVRIDGDRVDLTPGGVSFVRSSRRS
jgi:Mn-dependent DtxR family transcriptional regulator